MKSYFITKQKIFTVHVISVLWTCFFCIPALFAQNSPNLYQYPYNHIPWYTIESEHFKIHFQKGNSRSAQVASQVAENVYPDIATLYNYESNDVIDIVLIDREDYSNGAAYFFNNQIDIWIPALDTPLRGTHDWMRNVITHELTHIIQLQKSMKRNRTIPAIYLQWLSYEDVRRPDVLYGFPNGLISYPFSSISVPAWFAEGVAQYQRSHWNFDTWDSHRDMLLRTSILNNSYLTLTEMGTFTSKNGLEREMVYNQGYAFSIYLAERFGENIFAEISESLSRSGRFTIDKALENVTGVPGKELFTEWINERTSFYRQAIKDIVPGNPNIIEKEGYLNFHPKISADGTKLAYLSNKSDVSTALYIFEIGSEADLRDEITSLPVNIEDDKNWFHSGYSKLNDINSSYSFSPDNSSILFVRNKLNKVGEAYNDLFIYNIKEKETSRITRSQRVRDPAWNPAGDMIVLVREEVGTKNLYLYDSVNKSMQKITEFEDGEQIYTPVWHPDGRSVYFSFFDYNQRSIRKINTADHKIETVLSDNSIDFRDPYIDREGQFLYFSSDPDGIFNIYRQSLDEPSSINKKEKLTSVTGGAFMPYLDDNKRLFYSEYRDGGYKIVMDSQSPRKKDSTQTGKYNPPVGNDLFGSSHDRQLSDFEDVIDIDPLSSEILAQADTGIVNIIIPDSSVSNRRKLYEYNQTFSNFNLYPVLRFDNYSKLNGSNGRLLTGGEIGSLAENILRDMKVGINFYSSEVIGRFSIFGGALFGFGSKSADGLNDFFKPSRLTDLDRDLFLIAEHRGLPFIKKRWSPTVSLELFNLRRNVRDGLSVEEFPCTSCLPDTLGLDIAFDIFQADLFLRSKLNNRSLVELGVGYSPYSVETSGFFSRELEQFIPASSTEYFRSFTFSAGYTYEYFIPYRHHDVAPLGWKISSKYVYQPAELLDRFEVEDGTLSPVYDLSQNHSLEMDLQYGFTLNNRSTGLLDTRLFTYFNNPGDFFYLDYVGGFTGMRSYPFFAIGGNRTLFSRFSYIFPLFTDINRQTGRHTLDKLFLRMFAESGNGWGGPLDIGSNLKSGIGAELRFSLNSYYLYPLKFFISGAYGFNSFNVKLPDEFITKTRTGRVTYGQELLFHFGLTFDFDILNHGTN